MLIAVAAVAPAAPREDPARPVDPAAAAAQVATCGFKSARPRFDHDVAEDVIEVPDVTSASEAQLRCAALASLGTSYFVVFPPAVEQGYLPLYQRLSDEQEKAAARIWLAKRGLLARLPIYDTAATDEASFARALERLCGRKAAGALQPMHGMATFSPGAMWTLTKRGSSKGKLDDETFRCLVNASTASGYPIGFIGNGPSE
ncbi:MAG TPA: hypothetical protein VGC56_14930 [Allosphingosinicella sp.]